MILYDTEYNVYNKSDAPSVFQFPGILGSIEYISYCEY